MPIFDNSGSLRVVGDRAGNIAVYNSSGTLINSAAQFLQFSGSAVANVTSTATSGVLVELVGGTGTGTSTFTKGAIFNYPVVPRSANVWRSDASHILSKIRAIMTGSTGATASFQVAKNGSGLHLSATLNLTANDFWFDGGTILTTSYAAGDYMQIRLLGVSGTVEYATIQADFTS